MRLRRSAASVASVQIRSAWPPYSSATTAHSSWTRRAIARGNRWMAGRSRNASSSVSGSIAAIDAASSVPIRCLSRRGPENACWTVTCWSIANPMRSASGSDAISRFASSESVK